MFRAAEQRSQPPLSTFALVAVGGVAVGCCVGCAVVAAHLSGFPLLVFGGCACVLALAAATALVVYPRRRDVTAAGSPATPPERR
jgi:hypothetical protein